MKKRENSAAHKSCFANVVAALGKKHAQLAAPVSADAVTDFERELGLPLPPELVDLLAHTNGATGDGGEEWLWSLEKIRATNRELRSDKKLQAAFMPLDHFLFFASLPNGNLLGFRVLPFVIDSQVVQWCRTSDNRGIMTFCLGTYFERLFSKSKVAWQTVLAFDAEAVLNRCPVKSIDEISAKLNKYYETRYGLKERHLAEFEKESGLRLPPEMKALYLLTDGVQDGWWTVFPIDRLLEVNAAQRLRAAKEGDEFYLSFESMFFFGEEGNGDLYGFPVANGEVIGRVFRWDHETDDREIVAPNLLSFLQYQIEFKEEEEDEEVVEDHCRSAACELYEDDEEEHDEREHTILPRRKQ